MNKKARRPKKPQNNASGKPIERRETKRKISLLKNAIVRMMKSMHEAPK